MEKSLMKKRLIFITCLVFLIIQTIYALEDFTDYIEVDPGTTITVDTDTVSWNDLETRGSSSYVYKDKGASHFDGDFEHKFKCQFSDGHNLNQAAFWMMANAVGDIKALRDADEDFLCFFYYLSSEVNYLYLQIYENGEQAVSANWDAAVASTTYYVRLPRDDDGGANSTGQIKAYIATTNYDNEGGDLKVELTVDCSVGEQNDFQHIYVLNTYNSASASTCDGFTEELNLQEGSQIINAPLKPHVEIARLSLLGLLPILWFIRDMQRYRPIRELSIN